MITEEFSCKIAPDLLQGQGVHGVGSAGDSAVKKRLEQGEREGQSDETE